MKLIAAEDNVYIFDLARGEELIETLVKWCQQKKIAGATLTGLGAADKLELAYYNLASKSYEQHTTVEEVEILSLTGNLGELNSEKMLHIHGVFGRKDLSTFGGHVFSLCVSGACEIY